MAVRNDKLKKLETELKDLEQWLKLGLVPKKDIPKHEEEIASLTQKIEAERDKARYIKESGETEGYVTPRKVPGRAGYADTPTMPDVEITEERTATTETSTEREQDSIFDTSYDESASGTETTETVVEEEEEDPFSDANRWKRGMLHSDDDEW